MSLVFSKIRSTLSLVVSLMSTINNFDAKNCQYLVGYSLTEKNRPRYDLLYFKKTMVFTLRVDFHIHILPPLELIISSIKTLHAAQNSGF